MISSFGVRLAKNALSAHRIHIANKVATDSSLGPFSVGPDHKPSFVETEWNRISRITPKDRIT